MHSADSISILLLDVAAVSLLAVLWRRFRRQVVGRRVRRSLRMAVRRELGPASGAAGRESATEGDGLAA